MCVLRVCAYVCVLAVFHVWFSWVLCVFCYALRAFLVCFACEFLLDNANLTNSVLCVFCYVLCAFLLCFVCVFFAGKCKLNE